MHRLRYFSLFVCLLAVCITAHAQTGNAGISGRVVDHSGAVIQKANVSIKNIDINTTIQSQTNDVGIYVFPSVKPGNYVMRVEKQGFRSVDVTGLTLYTQDQLARNFSLEVGSSSESITVTGGTTNDSPAVSMTVSREFVQDTPLNGRSFQDLIQLAPGAVVSGGSGASTGYYSINGQRTDANNYSVDGVSANAGGYNNEPNGNGGAGLSGSAPSQTALGTTQSLVSVDSLQEFTIQTSGYTAEYGRNPGGQVQFTTRSGSNDLHGTLFDYFRNTALDANSYMNNYNDIPKSAEHQNDFGGTIGGPLVVPKLYSGKDKTFYFFSYEGLRLLLPAFESEYVPTQAFRNWASPNVRPFLNAKPLPNPDSPGNQDACTVIDPASGTPAACDAIFNYGYSSPNDLDNISVRIDQRLGSRVTAFVRYADTPSSSRNGAEQVSTSSTNVQSWTVGVTANLTSTLLDEFRFGYIRDNESNTESMRAVGGSMPFARNLLIPAAYDGPFASASAYIDVPSTSVYVSPYLDGAGTTGHQYNLVDSITLTRGVHTIKVGGDWRRYVANFSSYPYQSVLEITSLADIQNGTASFIQTSAEAAGTPVFDNLSLYAQDHWKLSSRLTLDYGLRWEFNPPPGPSNGHYPITLTSDNLANAQIAPQGTKPYQSKYDKFAPRFGFAWVVYPSQKHSLTARGGFGIFFDTAQQAIGNAYTGAYPFTATGAGQNEVPLPLTDADLAPPSLNFPIVTPYPFLEGISSPKLTLPYTEQWNLSLDEAVTGKNTLTVSYVGNNGRKLLFSQYYGNVPSNPAFANGLIFTGNGAQSSYNAFQVQDLGRLALGLELVAGLTVAHALDNASGSYSSYAPIYGNSDNDLRRVLNLALNYRMTRMAHGWLEKVSNGWLFVNRFSTQSGYPFNVIQTSGLLPNGTRTEYSPDLAAGVPIYLHGQAADVNGQPVPGNWRVNPAAFVSVPTGSGGIPLRQGTLGRNYVRSPSFWSLNTAVQRSFPLYEQLHLNFRVDAFNILNHPNPNAIDNYLTDSTFGQDAYGIVGTIGSRNPLYGMGAARSLQLSLKLQF